MTAPADATSLPRPIPAERPARLSPAAIASFAARPLVTHSGMNVDRFFALHIMGALLPVTAGFLLYGWRAVAIVALTIATSMISLAFWRKIGSRGTQLRAAHVLWMSLLLALMLPAHLLTDRPLAAQWPAHLWAVVPGAAMLLVMLIWLLGGVGSSRVHPVLVTYLFLIALLGPMIVPHWLLQRNRIAVGDLSKAVELPSYSREGWLAMQPIAGSDALNVTPPSQRLIAYTTGSQRSEQNWLSLDSLLRDEMPPLEDLIIGAQPGPIGASSGIAVIVGGLFLLYRGVIDFRIPLLIALAAFAAFLILPIPLVETETGVTWRWLAIHQAGINPSAVVAFANYEMMAGPLLFVAFFLATSPSIRPMARRARLVYAILIGVTAAALQLYLSVSFGAFLALLIITLLTPAFDRFFRPHPLV